ncbi:MAG: hypothetical protein QM532_02300 [Cyanobium sp. MAG06]|nr:hypothetical protein [Cyanobium sp. MAG06]
MKLDNINVVENYNLNNILTMKSGGVAKYYYEYNGDESELRRIMDFTKDNNLKYYILGWGSNTIFLNDFDGIIIRNNYKNINILSKMDDKIKIKVGGGEA